MFTPAGRNAFREFLRTEFSEENMLFWMACEELKKEANKNVIKEKAKIIYENYISILSPKEVCAYQKVFSQEAVAETDLFQPLVPWQFSSSKMDKTALPTLLGSQMHLTVVPPMGSKCPLKYVKDFVQFFHKSIHNFHQIL